MSILDHFGYPTKPLVEFNMLMYTDRASFMGWLNHITERRRLEIILDPSASGPLNVKNKRVQVNLDLGDQLAEPEGTSSLQSTSYGSKRPKRVASKRPRKVSESDVEEDTKPSKGKKKDKKGKGTSKSKPSSTKPNTSAYGDTSDKGGEVPKTLCQGTDS